jgi:hypothetical protein
MSDKRLKSLILTIFYLRRFQFFRRDFLHAFNAHEVFWADLPWSNAECEPVFIEKDRFLTSTLESFLKYFFRSLEIDSHVYSLAIVVW